MWPFNKKSDSIPSSGICDYSPYCKSYKDHKWTKWEQYIQNAIFINYKTGNTVPCIHNMQKRICLICGFEERKETEVE